MASSSGEDFSDGSEELELSYEQRRSLQLAIINEQMTKYARFGNLMAQYIAPSFCKQPRRTSKQTGAMWVQEVLQGHDVVCQENFRVEKHVFRLLCSKLRDHGLRHTQNIGVEEMVAMFLYIVGHGQGNRIIQERFQHSGETVSRIFHKVLKASFRLSTKNIKPLDPEFRQCHKKIANDARYHPYFKDCIGAIGGTHIKCVVSPSKQDKYIGRKGYPTQNIMAVCDWDMCFTFVLAGWEGTAHDARLFRIAIETPTMNFPHPPEGKYYLVDVGYPTPVGYIGPYKHERYHFPEFRRQSGFRNPNKYFNFYHSSFRCTIERTFRVWKNRFHILQNMPSYSFRTQVRIVCATMAIHNFIRRYSHNDVEFDQVVEGNMGDEDNDNPVDEASSLLSSTQMNRLRDQIRNQLVGTRFI